MSELSVTMSDEMIEQAVGNAVTLVKVNSTDSSFGAKSPTSPITASSYITTNNAMRATSASLALVSAVLSFDIVELWTEEVDGQFRCIFVHVEPDFIAAKPRPSVISGYYPTHKREHKISPNICLLTKHSNEKFHWRTEGGDGTNSVLELKKAIASDDGKYNDLSDIQTELCYKLDTKTEKASVYIVGFATDRIEYKPAKVKFLSGLSYAIYIAAYDLDETDDGVDVEQLDVKNDYVPRSFSNQTFPSDPRQDGDVRCEYIPRSFSTAAFDPDIVKENDGDYYVNPWEDLTNAFETDSHNTSISSYKNPGDVGDDYDEAVDIDTKQRDSGSLIRRNMSYNSLAGGKLPRNESNISLTLMDGVYDSSSLPSLPPTWAPADHFSFPISRIPVTSFIESNLTLDAFTNIVHIGDGTNSNIYRAELYNQTVVVKMIKEEIKTNPVTVHEFDVEHSMLSRLDHPNIIKILGAGKVPRRFIVLEYLEETVTNVLTKRTKQSGFSLFRKPVFTYSEILEKSAQLASALHYIHDLVHTGATILHRDLKPDNVGLGADGSLKLFDFGLSTCVNRRTSPLESYKMTGNTGSLRYMAPEVVLSKPYNEKVDVYSFGIILWQLASEATPFKGFSRDDFLSKVVAGDERPKIDKSWPNGFTSIIVSCWHKDPLQRPPFATIVARLQSLIDELNRSRFQRGKSIFKNVEGSELSEKKSEKKSGWF